MDQATKNLEFDFAVKNPGRWLLEALQLKQAADRVDWIKHSDFGLQKAFLLLVGQATENLLKGIWIAHGESLFAPNGKMRFKSHDLLAIVDALGIGRLVIDPAERAVLARLGKYVRFAGRYPIPTSADQVIPISHNQDDYEAEFTLFHKLFEHLQRQGWWDFDGVPRIKLTGKGLLDSLPKPARRPRG